MDNMVEQVVEHLKTSRVQGADDFDPGDLVTGAVVIVRVERLDEDEPSFAVVHTGDYITATGLITLAYQIGSTNIEERE